MTSDDKLSRLVAQLYEASMDETQWGTVAEEVIAAFDAPSMLLAVCDTATGAAQVSAATANMTEARIRTWNEYYHKVDLYLALGPKVGASNILLGQEWIPQDVWLNSEIYRDYARHVDMCHFLGSWIQVRGSTACALGIHRPERAAAFDDQASRRAAAFVPHLQRALQMKLRLEEVSLERDRAQALVDRMDCGVMVVDRNSRILSANRYAEEVLAAGACLVSHHGHLLAASLSPTANRMLRHMIRASVDVMTDPAIAPGGSLTLPRDGGPPIAIQIAPFRWRSGSLLPMASAAIVFIRDLGRRLVGGATFQALFGLTAAEGAVATALVEGMSIDEIAALHGVSRNTVRTQLSSVKAKTGTGRQGELIALLARIVPSAS